MGKQINKQGVKQAVRFCVVGFFNTLVDYGLFFVFISFVNLHKSIAQVFSTSVAMCGSYLINRYWTFGQSGRGNFGEIVKFLTINLLAMFSVILFTHLFYDIWHLENLVNAALRAAGSAFAAEGDIAILLCKAAASCFSLMINFFGNKFWVFRGGRQTETEA